LQNNYVMSSFIGYVSKWFFYEKMDKLIELYPIKITKKINNSKVFDYCQLEKKFFKKITKRCWQEKSRLKKWKIPIRD